MCLVHSTIFRTDKESLLTWIFNGLRFLGPSHGVCSEKKQIFWAISAKIKYTNPAKKCMHLHGFSTSWSFLMPLMLSVSVCRMIVRARLDICACYSRRWIDNSQGSSMALGFLAPLILSKNRVDPNLGNQWTTSIYGTFISVLTWVSNDFRLLWTPHAVCLRKREYWAIGLVWKTIADMDLLWPEASWYCLFKKYGKIFFLYLWCSSYVLSLLTWISYCFWFLGTSHAILKQKKLPLKKKIYKQMS